MRRWKEFVRKKDLNPFQYSVNTLLEFLTVLFKAGLGYSAINTARSAVSAIVFSDSVSLGSHPLIVRFMKGVFELRTPQSKYSFTWDVQILFDYFKTCTDKSAKFLTHKLCALLMLATAQRVQTLHTLKLSNICFTNLGCTIFIDDKLKHSRIGYHQPPIKLKYFPEKSICPVTCLKEYLDITKKPRGNQNELFLSYQSPYLPASKDTISRWLRFVLKSAGIHNFAPHSFRSAASSNMYNQGMDLGEILKTAGWSRASTFYKFYYKPCINSAKENKIQESKNSILNYFAKK